MVRDLEGSLVVTFCAPVVLSARYASPGARGMRQVRGGVWIDGPKGFYRGYLAALLTYIPNSAVWWPSYLFFAEQLSTWAPSKWPHLVLQGMAGPMAAVTASTLTNPMDVIRTRAQVEDKTSIIETFSRVLREEGAWGFTKGLSARILSAAPTAFVLVIGYETLKKVSLRQELVTARHW